MTHLSGRESGVEGDVGEGVDDGDEGARDGNGARQVAHRVFQLLDYEVQVVPGGREDSSLPADNDVETRYKEFSFYFHHHHSSHNLIFIMCYQIRVKGETK